MTKALVAGVGMIPFAKPGASESYEVMGATAARAALKDAGIDYTQVQQAYVGYVYGDSTCGQSALYPVGLTGIPIINVNNNCSTGSTALFMARQAVESGAVDVALALGFEQMVPGALGTVFTDRAPPMAMHSEGMTRAQGVDPQAPFAAQFFGGAGREYTKQHGTRPETFAKIASKARSHAANNPYAIFRDPLTVDEVMASKKIFDPLTRFQCCPPTCGAAAAVVVSERYARKHGIKGVTIVAQAMTTDTRRAFEGDSMIEIVGYTMARDAADAVYETAGVDPRDVGVVELHDCFTANELLSYEALRLTGDGTSGGVHLDRRQHLWRACGDQSVGRAALEGPSAGRDGAGTVHRTGVAAARPGGQAPGRGREDGAPAQSRAGRRVRGDAVPGLTT